MKILITGSNGFVGKILKSELEKKGYEVFGIDLQRNGENSYAVNITIFEQVHNCFQTIQPDYVIHLAAISYVDHKNPGQLYSVNVQGTINILTSAISLSQYPRILLVSSSQVYGDVDESLQPIREDTKLSPVNHYGASKAAIESISMAYRKEYGLPVVIARPFNHIGKGQNIHFLVPKIIQAFREKRKEIELGNIDVLRDFLDVRDVVRAYLRIIDTFPDGEIFNIASSQVYSIKDIISILKKITGHCIDITINQKFVRDNEIWITRGDYTKIHKVLGWVPQYTIEETMQWILYK